MFRGKFFHTIDDKGRVSLPSKFRTRLGKKFILSIEFDGCLSLYSIPERKKFEERLMSKPLTSGRVRDLRRVLMTESHEVSVDSLGRILVPAELRQYAGLQRDVIFAGQGNFVELWSKERWEPYIQSKREEYKDFSEDTGVVGL